MRPVSSRFLQSSSSFERASSSPRTRAKERKREHEKKNEGKREREIFSHEGVRSSCPLALRFFHPFFLSPPFSLSFIERLLLGPLRSSCSCLFFVRFSISSSYVLRSVIAHESLLSLAHFPPLPPLPPAKELLLSRWFSYSASSFFFSSVLLFSCGWLFFHPSSHQRESISPPQPPPPSTVPPSPFSSSFFVPVDRGVLHSSNLNAGRTGVLYRLRK